MTKHTPGPWWTDARYDGHEMGCAIIAARTDAGPLPGNPTRGMVAFATVALNTEARTCEANARLIAAAPDLLAALRDLVEAAHGGGFPHNAVTRAEDAITKATGAGCIPAPISARS